MKALLAIALIFISLSLLGKAFKHASWSYSPSEEATVNHFKAQEEETERFIDSFICPLEGLECDKPGCAKIIECNIGADGRYNVVVVHSKDTIAYDGVTAREYKRIANH